jgi:hypothetical protein
MAPRSVRFGVRSWKLSNVGQSLDGWARVVGYDPFCVIHKEGLCHSSEDTNRLVMMMRSKDYREG